MTAIGAMLGFPGDSRLLVGVEPDPDEPDLMRLYIDARYLNRFVLVDMAEGEKIRRQWGNAHAFVEVPKGTAVYQHDFTPEPYTGDEPWWEVGNQ